MGIGRNKVTYGAILRYTHYKIKHQISNTFQYSTSINDELDMTNSKTICRKLEAKTKTNTIEQVRKYFDNIPANQKNIYVYTTMITAYTRCNKLKEAEILVDTMLEHGIRPNHYTMTSLVRGYFKMGEISQGVTTLRRMVAMGLKPTEATYSAIIRGFSACQKINECERTFAQAILVNDITLDDILSATLLQSYIDNNQINEAIKYFEIMSDSVKSTGSCTIMMRMYIKMDQMSKALELYDYMLKYDIPVDSYTVSILILAFTAHRRYIDAEMVFKRHKHVGLDVHAHCALMISYAHRGMVLAARDIYSKFIKKPVAMYNTMIEAYLRVQQYDKAKMVFETMITRSVNINIDTFKVFIVAYALAYRFDQIDNMIQYMQLMKLKPTRPLLEIIIKYAASNRSFDVAFKYMELLFHFGYEISKSFLSQIEQYFIPQQLQEFLHHHDVQAQVDHIQNIQNDIMSKI